MSIAFNVKHFFISDFSQSEHKKALYLRKHLSCGALDPSLKPMKLAYKVKVPPTALLGRNVQHTATYSDILEILPDSHVLFFFTRCE